MPTARPQQQPRRRRLANKLRRKEISRPMPARRPRAVCSILRIWARPRHCWQPRKRQPRLRDLPPSLSYFQKRVVAAKRFQILAKCPRAAATSAVVTGIVWIIASDGLFAVLTERLRQIIDSGPEFAYLDDIAETGRGHTSPHRRRHATHSTDEGLQHRADLLVASVRPAGDDSHQVEVSSDRSAPRCRHQDPSVLSVRDM